MVEVSGWYRYFRSLVSAIWMRCLSLALYFAMRFIHIVFALSSSLIPMPIGSVQFKYMMEATIRSL
ncbi:hypothetical protein BDP27DRAFT_1336881 [Rhodocollybia butyracea]|uniref:Uncharacterized protein n=1 Tax=Rhodocollybia butyracea TaxID=206335 RepID=A0A9P5PGI0_9AGAR|nr:hypothetical protein BDP27DRAFT_1336881 [Rhodocollybia butyracea]